MPRKPRSKRKAEDKMAETFLNPAPQPGDGAFLVQNGGGRRRRDRRKPAQSFLIESPDIEYKAEDEDEVESRVDSSFLRPGYDFGKERMSSGHYSLEHEPPTIVNEKPLTSTTIAELQQSLPPRSTPLTSHPTNTNQAQDGSALSTPNKSPQLDEKMAIPPHLRRRKAQSISQTSKDTPSHEATTPTRKDTSTCNTTPPNERAISETVPPKVATGSKPEAKTSRPKINQKPTDRLSPPPAESNVTDIRENLEQDHGVKVDDPKPAQASKRLLVPYPSSDEDDAQDANARTSRQKQTRQPKGKANSSNEDNVKGRSSPRQRSGRGDRNANRGRGGGAFARAPPTQRDSKWPKPKEMAADSHRWDTKWGGESDKDSIDSARADSGWGDKKKAQQGIDPETGFKLTGWDGDWAPPPVNWDARPAFRDNQSAEKIENWKGGIKDAMVGVAFIDVPTEELAAVENEYGEIAPRFWIPIVIGKQAPQTFWNELVKSNEPKPEDEGDLNGAMPWWECYESKGSNLLKPREHPKIEGIDPDENRNERLARENDHGSNHHTENRKRLEKAKRDAEREKRKRAQEKSRKISKALSCGVNREPIKPQGKIYLRSAKPADMNEIRDIYNHYVSYSVCTPEIDRRTKVDMEQRYNAIVRNKFPFLVACERGEVVRLRRNKKYAEDSYVLPDKILGFAYADDHNDMLGVYRFTAEVEIFVHNGHYMKGIAKCLLDKLIGMLDPEYMERGGYDVEGEELEGIGPSRIIQNILINLPYETDKPVRLEWIGKWLTNWIGFGQIADLPKIGLKDGKHVSVATFHRTTGAHIDPNNPPISTGYTK